MTTKLLLFTARKASVSAVVAFLATLGTSLADGDLTTPELLVSLSAGLAAGVGVYYTTNEPADGE